MSNEIETQIDDELLRDKVLNFYKKFKIIIISISILLIISPILFQVNNYYKNSKDADLTAKYLKAEMLLQSGDSPRSLEILNSLKSSNNDAIKSLSISTLVKYYLDKDDKPKALKTIKDANNDFNSKIFKELNNIQEALLSFDTINESDLIKLLKTENNEFQNIKNKILYDFYIKNNQLKKAEEVK